MTDTFKFVVYAKKDKLPEFSDVNPRSEEVNGTCELLVDINTVANTDAELAAIAAALTNAGLRFDPAVFVRSSDPIPPTKVISVGPDGMKR